nr:immunoglobulin light chain junction region [Macaca mulatta]MOW62386.1 immunoglobulin light chain junction region [Macaca mulatta]MOW62762.1 immunoglobulin light chain junction region [Macaca mulatta]MOW63337.1 immunoglobulin light chain junction region [Macaca mulatta]MOW63476.1 immunoglobulin light chain junction region [Macaca mulatta]
CMQGIEFPVTF